MRASIGPNSAAGVFIGELKLEFNDKAIFRGKIPKG
jgi:hypothetical protein